jgi:ferritin-like metal-binding protein YciE
MKYKVVSKEKYDKIIIDQDEISRLSDAWELEKKSIRMLEKKLKMAVVENISMGNRFKAQREQNTQLSSSISRVFERQVAAYRSSLIAILIVIIVYFIV